MESKKAIRVVAAEIERDGRYLITLRRPKATMPLLWEFPGGRVEPGESDKDALARELKEVIGVSAVVGEQALHVVHETENITLDFVVLSVQISGTPQCLGVHDWRWVEPDDFGNYEFPGADQRTIEALLGEGPESDAT